MNSATREDARRARRVATGAVLRRLPVCLALLLCCAAARAQTPPPRAPVAEPEPDAPSAIPPPDPCALPPGKDKRGINEYFKCLKSKYELVTVKGYHGLHFVHGSVAPGGGQAGGVGINHATTSEHWFTQSDASARVSIKKYWELDANLHLEKFPTSQTPCTTKLGPQNVTKFDLYGLVKDMPRLDYFGTGPESREQDRAVYHYREGVVGADFSTASERHCWLDVGGAIEGIFPDIRPITNPTVRSVERVYNEATAPGLGAQPAYLHLAAYARIHEARQPEARKFEYVFLYHVYQDLQEHRYSFRRFDMDLRNKFPIGANTELRVRGRLSLSETSEGQRVPFYLMETLGGSNIRGDDTLRGFRDYRFRDRDYALVQTEFLQRFYGPLDFIAFYDTGKVASSVSRFGDGRLRHSYGLGIVVVPRQLDNVLFRFYVALGTGEGSHTYFGGGGTQRGARLIR
ncbi:MAG: hypothetical protein JOZ96_28575 [Acidobacteria bacterium]|nr:hypothetical protein [Acidobacteriota bacterium]